MKKTSYADLASMKTLLLLLTFASLFGEKLYETQVSPANRQAMQNKKIKCRWVCDKKLYKEQQIDSAVSFYKKSKFYHFTVSGFESFSH